MQGNYTQYPNNVYPQNLSPNAVSINIYSPQAYGNTTQNPISQNNPAGNFYPLYGTHPQQGMPIYPQNYNNMFTPNQNPIGNDYSAVGQNQGVSKTPQEPLLMNDSANNAQNNSQTNTTENKTTNTSETTKKEDKKEKSITPLSDEYIKSLENYLNDSNPKIRLIGAKEVLERFKEDENRKDNKSLIPLLNKTLRDTSAAVRFLGLTTLQLGYSVGNDETVQILKEIQTKGQDKFGEDQLLASEILLKMSAPQSVKVGG